MPDMVFVPIFHAKGPFNVQYMCIMQLVHVAQMSHGHGRQYLIQYMLNVFLLHVNRWDQCFKPFQMEDTRLWTIVLSLCVRYQPKLVLRMTYVRSGTFDDYFSNLCTCTPPPIASFCVQLSL